MDCIDRRGQPEKKPVAAAPPLTHSADELEANFEYKRKLERAAVSAIAFSQLDSAIRIGADYFFKTARSL